MLLISPGSHTHDHHPSSSILTVISSKCCVILADNAPQGLSSVAYLASTNQLPVSCVAAPVTCRPLPSMPLGSAPCYSPLCLMPLQQSNNALSLQPIHRQHVAYTSHYGRGCLSHFVLDPNMTHCLRQQPLAQTVRTPHLQKSELPWSSSSPFFNLSDRSYLKADTGFPLFGRCPY